jgi:hypothetical protein
MKRNLLTPLFMLIVISASAQDNSTISTKKQLPSMATIITMDGIKSKGWFYKMDSNNIYLLANGKKLQQPTGVINAADNNGVYTFQVPQIDKILLKKKHSGLKGTLIGLGAGVLIGTITGLASGNDPAIPYTGQPIADVFIGFGNAFAMTAGEKAVAGAIGLGLTGAVTGCLLGNLLRKKFIIGGRKDIYHDLHYELMQRLIIK